MSSNKKYKPSIQAVINKWGVFLSFSQTLSHCLEELLKRKNTKDNPEFRKDLFFQTYDIYNDLSNTSLSVAFKSTLTDYLQYNNNTMYWIDFVQEAPALIEEMVKRGAKQKVILQLLFELATSHHKSKSGIDQMQLMKLVLSYSTSTDFFSSKSISKVIKGSQHAKPETLKVLEYYTGNIPQPEKDLFKQFLKEPENFEELSIYHSVAPSIREVLNIGLERVDLEKQVKSFTKEVLTPETIAATSGNETVVKVKKFKL